MAIFNCYVKLPEGNVENKLIQKVKAQTPVIHKERSRLKWSKFNRSFCGLQGRNHCDPLKCYAPFQNHGLQFAVGIYNWMAVNDGHLSCQVVKPSFAFVWSVLDLKISSSFLEESWSGSHSEMTFSWLTELSHYLIVPKQLRCLLHLWLPTMFVKRCRQRKRVIPWWSYPVCVYIILHP